MSAYDELVDDGLAHVIAQIAHEYPVSAEFVREAASAIRALEAKQRALREATCALVESVQADVRQRDSRITIGTLHRVEEARFTLASLDTEKAGE